jgi:hypothetical protein
VGAGVLIAAFVALRSPHPVLTFAQQPDKQNCGHHGCAPSHPGSLANGKPGVRIHLPPHRTGHPAGARSRGVPSSAATAPTAPSSPAPPHASNHGGRGVTVSFRLFRYHHQQNQSNFAAFITVHSGKRLGAWRLQFVLPGTHIDRVWGATWQEWAGGDGGVATGQPWPWPHSGDKMVRIGIMGYGTPGRPAGCVFDHIACTFSDHHGFG